MQSILPQAPVRSYASASTRSSCTHSYAYLVESPLVGSSEFCTLTCTVCLIAVCTHHRLEEDGACHGTCGTCLRSRFTHKANELCMDARGQCLTCKKALCPDHLMQSRPTPKDKCWHVCVGCALSMVLHTLQPQPTAREPCRCVCAVCAVVVFQHDYVPDRYGVRTCHNCAQIDEASYLMEVDDKQTRVDKNGPTQRVNSDRSGALATPADQTTLKRAETMVSRWYQELEAKARADNTAQMKNDGQVSKVKRKVNQTNNHAQKPAVQSRLDKVMKLVDQELPSEDQAPDQRTQLRAIGEAILASRQVMPESGPEYIAASVLAIYRQEPVNTRAEAGVRTAVHRVKSEKAVAAAQPSAASSTRAASSVSTEAASVSSSNLEYYKKRKEPSAPVMSDHRKHQIYSNIKEIAHLLGNPVDVEKIETNQAIDLCIAVIPAGTLNLAAAAGAIVYCLRKSLLFHHCTWDRVVFATVAWSKHTADPKYAPKRPRNHPKLAEELLYDEKYFMQLHVDMKEIPELASISFNIELGSHAAAAASSKRELHAHRWAHFQALVEEFQPLGIPTPVQWQQLLGNAQHPRYPLAMKLVQDGLLTNSSASSEASSDTTGTRMHDLALMLNDALRVKLGLAVPLTEKGYAIDENAWWTVLREDTEELLSDAIAKAPQALREFLTEEDIDHFKRRIGLQLAQWRATLKSAAVPYERESRTWRATVLASSMVNYHIKVLYKNIFCPARLSGIVGLTQGPISTLITELKSQGATALPE